MGTLVPALAAYRLVQAGGVGFRGCLQALSTAAAEGRDSTLAMQARIGRAAQLPTRRAARAALFAVG